jgi:ankyrin repeat protein
MNTSLHLAAEASSIPSLTLLLQYNPSLNIKNYQGLTPYSLCSNVKARNLFEEFGENGEENYGRTFIGDIIRNNSRADYVEKFLHLGNKNKKL